MTLIFFIISLLLLMLATRLDIKSRKKICFLVMCFYAVIIAGSYTNLDYLNYRMSYELGVEYTSHTSEWFYHLLKVVSIRYLKLDYNGFRLLLAAPSIILFAATCKRYTKSYEYILLLYTIYPLFFDVTAIRNFAAMTILLFSVRYLEESNVKNLIKYIACMVIASGLHILFAAFFILCVVYFANKSKFVKTILIISAIIGFVIALMPSSLINMMSIVLSFVKDDRTYKFEGIGTRYGYLLWWGFQIFYVIIASYGKQITDTIQLSKVANSTEENYSIKQKRLVDIVYLVSLVALLFCPLYRIQGNFTRLLKNLLPLLYIQSSCVNVLLRRTHNTVVIHKKRLIYNVYVVLFAVLYASEVFFVEGLWNSMVVETLTHNWIIEAIFGMGW